MIWPPYPTSQSDLNSCTPPKNTELYFSEKKDFNFGTRAFKLNSIYNPELTITSRELRNIISVEQF